jgi:peptide-methionine (R)-S-oxide reductase
MIQIDRRLFLASAAALAIPAPVLAAADPYANSPFRKLTDAQWKARLSPGAYEVLRHAATEIPGTSPLLKEHRRGNFHCAGCGLVLFNSKAKFESGTGWPSFYTAIKGAFVTKTDMEIGIPRTEYHCAQCLGHHGHVFNDGPKPTGLRYCNNGVALTFKPV